MERSSNQGQFSLSRFLIPIVNASACNTGMTTGQALCICTWKGLVSLVPDPTHHMLQKCWLKVVFTVPDRFEVEAAQEVNPSKLFNDI